MALARVRGPGHPDLLCDLVAATIAQEYLLRDPAACLDIRVMGGRGALFVTGELASQADFDVSAVVRRVVAESGVMEEIEPFIALEPMGSAWAMGARVRESLAVMGYATKETPERMPRVVATARLIAQALEHERIANPDWFWLGTDYDVWAEEQGKTLQVMIRAAHVETVALTDIRTKIIATLSPLVPGVVIQVNVAGEEYQTGLGKRIGASGRASSAEQWGSLLPSSPPGSGRHLLHPTNVGAWIVRALARELIAAGKGQAIQVRAYWHPLDTKPSQVVIRNERGEDLSTSAILDRFDPLRLPESWQRPSLLVDSLRAPFINGIVLPWEQGM
jgi:S-adenosylmethionine synthetase